MKTSIKVLIGILAIILIIALPLGNGYNNLVKLEQNVAVAKSNIDTQLQRRMDLIPNLVNTVKGYASQEKEIFTAIADSRSKLAGATNVNEQAQADSELSNALSRLLVVVERYPDLKSNQNFQDLSVQLEGTENRITIARQDYNTAVSVYNTKIRQFPSNIVASLFGFESHQLYEAAPGSEQAPTVNFGS
nr:LemA family protein [uncultured Niameybacter sp.]